MKYFKTHEFLHEVFGERQSLLEVICTIAFALFGTWTIYDLADISVIDWKVILAFILIADVLAGCIANFSVGTNEYYSQRPKNRLIFIAIHVHILVIAWLLSEPMQSALIIWGYTIASAFVVNALKGRLIQRFVAANLMCVGLFILVSLSLAIGFLLVSLFFLIKVLFSFSVDHYDNAIKE